MYAQLRVARLGAARAAVQSQRRVSTLHWNGDVRANGQLLATPTGLPPAPPPSGAAPVRPVVVTSGPVVPGSSTLPPPAAPGSAAGLPPPPPPPSSLPPPPPKQRGGFFRRVLVYTTLGVLIFYPTSAWLSTQYESYREFFTSTFPGGEALADYADEKHWETFGVGSVSQKAVQGWQKVTGEPTPSSATAAQRQSSEARVREAVGDAERKARQLKDQAAGKVKQGEAEVEQKARQAKAEAEKAASNVKAKAQEVKADAKAKAQEFKADAKGKAQDAKAAISDAASKVSKEAASLKDKAVSATQDAAAKAQSLAAEAKDKVVAAAPAVPFNFSEGIEGLVRQAEHALEKGEAKAENLAERAKDAVTPAPTVGGPRVLPDTQRPRELRPETVKPAKPSFEGKEVYKGTLPLGFEPPPGYYIPPPVAAKKQEEAAEAPKPLPLLAPKIKEFAADEPVITQLASTIDSLTSTLSAPATSAALDATGILTKAQDDLSALSSRLDEIKKAERAKLEGTVAEKTKEFEALLKTRDAEKEQSEASLKASWQGERQKLVEQWKDELEKELESQRQGIENRLQEEVVSQGIELQRRWLRSIKAQVESERGGRLAKLDNLSTSFKQLERITLDNSATLDDNVRLHKIWSALRAVQTKADAGDLAFDDELRALKSLAGPSTVSADSESSSASAKPTVITATLTQLEKSGIPQTGVKSFASLSSWFTNSVAPKVHSAALVPAPEEASVVSHLASSALSYIMFRPKAGLVDGQDVGSILARAEWCLAEKDLDGAAREVNRLKGWPARLANDWLREARRTLEVRQALEVVGTEATLSSLLLV